MVGPRNLKPRFFKSRAKAMDSLLKAGKSSRFLRFPSIGLFFTKFHIYWLKVPNSFCTSRNFFFLKIFRNPPTPTPPPGAGFKIGKRLPITISLLQDRKPRESGLRAFENEKLKNFPVVFDRFTPLSIVVPNHQRIAPC